MVRDWLVRIEWATRDGVGPTLLHLVGLLAPHVYATSAHEHGYWRKPNEMATLMFDVLRHRLHLLIFIVRDQIEKL